MVLVLNRLVLVHFIEQVVELRFLFLVLKLGQIREVSNMLAIEGSIDLLASLDLLVDFLDFSLFKVEVGGLSKDLRHVVVDGEEFKSSIDLGAISKSVILGHGSKEVDQNLDVHLIESSWAFGVML